MASEQQVKRYLAYWFQLGKKVLIRNGQSALLPKQVIVGDRYSPEFETIWQQILSADSGDCYLEGTEETIAELLTPEWIVEACARCEMPIPIKNVGMPPACCPCFNLSGWPNQDLPGPREPICSQERLSGIRDRLFKTENQHLPQDDLSTALPKSDAPTPQQMNSSQECLGKIRDRLHKASNH